MAAVSTPSDASAAYGRRASTRFGSPRAASAWATGRSSATSTLPARSSASRLAGSRTGRRTSPARYGMAGPAALLCLYASLRCNVSVPSGASASGLARNGPVPAVPRAIAVCGPARCARNGPNAVRRSNRTVRASTAETRTICGGSSKSIAYEREPRPRSKLATTAAASSGDPSWKWIPSRSVSVHVAPSLANCHADASPAVITPPASRPTRVSKICRVATNEAASAVHGSSEVISAPTATRREPPVCTELGAGVDRGATAHEASSSASATEARRMRASASSGGGRARRAGRRR